MHDEAFSVGFSRLKLSGLLVLSVGFVLAILAGLGFFGQNPFPREPDSFGRFILWVSSAFFGATSISIAIRLVRGGTAYRFDRKGIHLGRNSNLVPWESVRMARKWIQTVPSNSIFPVRRHYLVFDVDPEFEAGLATPKIWMHNLNHRLSGGSHAISAVGTECNLDVIIEGFNRFAPERLTVLLD